MRLVWSAGFALVWMACAQAVGAAPSPATDLVTADLVAEPAAVRPGEPFWLGIRLRMKERWHTYWRNPGDSGLPTEAKWTLPPGFEAGAIVWPTPERIPVGHLANYGYEGETVLLVPITPPPQLDASKPAAIKADLSWLACETECVPGEASVAIDLPVAAPNGSSGPDPATRDLFAAARARLPQPFPWPARLLAEGDVLKLSIAASGLRTDQMRSATFFPVGEGLIDNAAPQPLAPDGDGLVVALKRADLRTALPAEAEGVLVLDEDTGAGPVRRSFAVTAPVEGGPVASGSDPPLPSAAAAASAHAGGILGAALLAFAGGLILNLMPCVFPVLSIKILGLLRGSESGMHSGLHGFSYTAGVLLAFLALAGVLIGLRAGGAEIGWGFQLQSPVVVAALALVLFAMGLSLSGVYHLGGSLGGVGDRLARRAGLSGSFFTGVLATVVATPCTAPFMGAAIGFALTQPAPIALSVFVAMGTGLAAPVLALTLLPSWRERLPRPGPWMETLKQALAFPLYATAAWLLWVLSQQAGPSGLLAALLGLVAVAFGAWCFELSRRSGGARAWAQGLSAAALAGAALALVAVARDRGVAGSRPETAGAEAFSEARLERLLAEDRPVFVNMTAAWCLTCLVNERAVLTTATVQAAFAAKNVAYLKGDWTNRNPEISRVLERHGRNGVPLYLVYRRGREPAVLPQILTPSIVLASIEGEAPRSAERRAGFAPRP